MSRVDNKIPASCNNPILHHLPPQQWSISIASLIKRPQTCLIGGNGGERAALVHPKQNNPPYWHTQITPQQPPEGYTYLSVYHHWKDVPPKDFIRRIDLPTPKNNFEGFVEPIP